MRLTLFSDYALRTLIFCESSPDKLVTIQAISAAYGISRNHLMKITHLLSTAGYLETVRGKGGGLRLALPADQIKIGAVLRATEVTTDLVECANRKTNTCVISPACGLKHALFAALESFYASLDKLSLADITKNHRQLNIIFERQTAKTNAAFH